MGATVDHLESHHRYTVIRGFTDAKGVRVPFEASGVIRMIDISDDVTEIYIDWEREGVAPGGPTERLTFLMKATDGPRTNHMRTYFEKGDLVMPPRERKPAAAAPSPAAPPAPQADPSLARFEGLHPQEEICLNENRVACGCDPAFHRTVWPLAQLGVNACLRCGAVTVTRQVGDDGRHTGNAWTAYWTVPTSQVIVDWLAQFPRMNIAYGGAPWRWPMAAELVRYPILVYPAGTRVADTSALEALETRLGAEQATQSRAWCIGSACTNISAVPPDVLEALNAFIVARHALYIRAGSDLDILKSHAHLRSPSCELAADLLLRRPDAYGVMMEWLASPDENTFSAGIAMLRDARRIFSGPDDPRLAPQVLRILDGLSLEPAKDVPGRVETCLRFESFLVAIADLGANSPAMLDGLSALAAKLHGKDRYVADAARVVINELNGIDNRPPEYRKS